jgi:hypothetical protein
MRRTSILRVRSTLRQPRSLLLSTRLQSCRQPKDLQSWWISRNAKGTLSSRPLLSVSAFTSKKYLKCLALKRSFSTEATPPSSTPPSNEPQPTPPTPPEAPIAPTPQQVKELSEAFANYLGEIYNFKWFGVSIPRLWLGLAIINVLGFAKDAILATHDQTPEDSSNVTYRELSILQRLNWSVGLQHPVQMLTVAMLISIFGSLGFVWGRRRARLLLQRFLAENPKYKAWTVQAMADAEHEIVIDWARRSRRGTFLWIVSYLGLSVIGSWVWYADYVKFMQQANWEVPEGQRVPLPSVTKFLWESGVFAIMLTVAEYFALCQSPFIFLSSILAAVVIPVFAAGTAAKRMMKSMNIPLEGGPTPTAQELEQYSVTLGTLSRRKGGGEVMSSEREDRYGDEEDEHFKLVGRQPERPLVSTGASSKPKPRQEEGQDNTKWVELDIEED